MYALVYLALAFIALVAALIVVAMGVIAVIVVRDLIRNRDRGRPSSGCSRR
jgi:hypothetical protein